MEDLNVIDLVFLEGYDNPTISVVCKVIFECVFSFVKQKIRQLLM
jgi:hypothetical protein